MTRLSLLFVFGLAAAIPAALAQNCGPQYGGQICAAGNCCSQYGWCDTSPAHCDPATCQRAYSGAGSSCSGTSPPPPPPSSTPPGGSFPSTVPSIDICGTGSGGGISCPGAGAQGFFYRCCSGNGHCGPKNTEQSQADYCGAGCQPGYGDCSIRTVPAAPPPPQGTAGPNENCGPITNKRCAGSLCCSGSNYCGTGPDFCGAANWCQVNWGTCHR